MKYKGYEICTSCGGGKAGRGCNKTATVQVREPFNADTYLLLKQIRYTVADPASLQKAVHKARAFVDDRAMRSSRQ